MDHQIKINRAHKLAPKLPMAAEEIWASIPDELIAELTARQLAHVANALDTHWHKAKASAEREITADGCVWSEQDHQLLEVCPATTTAMPLHTYIDAYFNGSQVRFAEAQCVQKQQVTQWLSKDIVVVGNEMYSHRRKLSRAT